MKKMLAAFAATVGIGIGIAAAPAHADAVGDFYKGRNVIVVVGSDPGGGYDIYARL